MSLTKVSYSMIAGAEVNVLDYGADPTGVADSTAAIQAAINYACSLVTAASRGDPINGATVTFKGVFKITAPLVVSQGNVVLDGQGGTTIYPYYTSKVIAGQTYNGAPPVFIIGTAALWQGANSYSNTNKYNRINGFMVKRVSGASYIGAIGVLVSGTRNASVTNLTVEEQYCGVYLENTSEFYGQQISSIGCTYGYILDSRYNRTAAQSPLNLSCTAQDVSSCAFNMITAYYPQSSGFLAMNCGTISVNGMTCGLFSTSIDTSGDLGLPAVGAGVFLFGGQSNNGDFTRGMLFNDIVFEADPTINSSCVYLDANNAGTPIGGVTFNNCVVQTYASNLGGNVSTIFVQAYAGANAEVNYVKVSNSGFIYQTSGYYYGTMANVSGNCVIVFDDCYPNVAFSSSNNIGQNSQIKSLQTLEQVNIDAFPPTGWTTTGTITGCTKQGGSSGIPSSIKLTGSTGEITIDKTFTYREYQYDNAAAFVNLLVRGDADLALWCRVNGVSSTDSNSINANTITYYSNALYLPKANNSGTYRRIMFCFQPFSANYPFDNVAFHIGKAANASSSTFAEITNILVGYVKGGPVAYNPF